MKIKDLLHINSKNKHEKILCLIGYTIISTFFIALYLIMFMTYEDLYQAAARINDSIPTIIHDTYYYLPRIGEFFQHIAVPFMTISASLGTDIIFRLLTASMSILLIYLCTFFIIGRKPSLRYKDFIIYGTCFLLLMILETSEVFMFRFSYANNYIIAGVLTFAFLLPFRLKTKTNKLLPIIAMFILGILFGMSTEIGPLAIIVIFVTWFLIKLFKKNINLKKFLETYRLQLFSLIGAVVGLTIYHLSGSLGNRIENGYAEYYDYVSIFSAFKDGILVSFYKLWQHAWFNLRYLMFAPILISIFILVDNLVSKRLKIKSQNWKFYTCILAFFALYMAASCQIKVLDGLYPRYFFLVYLAVFCAILFFIHFLIKTFKISKKAFVVSSSIIVTLSTIAVLDMVLAFTIYHAQIGDQLDKIQLDSNANLIVSDDYTRATMTPSLIFKFAQLPPFEWGDTGTSMKYGYGSTIEK